MVNRLTGLNSRTGPKNGGPVNRSQLALAQLPSSACQTDASRHAKGRKPTLSTGLAWLRFHLNSSVTEAHLIRWQSAGSQSAAADTRCTAAINDTATCHGSFL